MTMYKCVECGHLFEEGEEAKWSEDRGECWGAPCYQEMSGCPACEGAYEEAYPCKMCGSYEDVTDIKYCEECITEVKKKFEKMLLEFDEDERKILSELGIYEW